MEVMIWLNHVGQYPVGSLVGTVKIWDVEWDFWYGTTSWEVFTFVSKHKERWCAESRDLFDFFDYLWAD